ncbi:membrane protein insertase YidC [Sediminibacillus massiliensis]|uniref:membrane protein insertase YidC n=1 Tax=Sediminibacillus massiliensis TaxID=1926277 RepID=UPI001FEA3904|nr:membrane protein insertase YidC [Sediminibacillus massiliensis]
MKRLFFITNIFIFTTLLLSGCSGSDTGDGGFLHLVFVAPFTYLIKSAAYLFDGSYGIAIILVTLLIRLLLMPFMLKQYKNQKHMKEKMAVIKPEMDRIQQELKKSEKREDQAELQKEMMELYRKHGVNPLSMGCLPMLIQMPVLMGFYYAIKSSTEIATHTFLWFNLGEPNIPLALIAGAIYFLQFKVQQKSMPVDQQQGNQMIKLMGLISPAMILIVSLNLPAALPLYWSVGGLFVIMQTLFAHNVYLNDSKERLEESAPSNN